MKWIISACIAVVAAMLLYGVVKAKTQLSDGASIIVVSQTYQNMNPISRYGYKWVMKSDSVINHTLIKTSDALDDLTEK